MPETTSPKRRIAPATLALVAAALLALVAIIVAATRGGGEAAPDTNQAAAAAAPAGPTAQAQNVQAMIADLRQRLAQDPDNHQGWFLLGMAYRDLEQFQQAGQAFRRAMELQPANPDYLAATGEALLLIGAEGSQREAEALFRRALAIKRDHAQSRYYLATLKDLAGNHSQAVDELLTLLRDAPADAGWAAGVRNTVQEIAQRNHIDIAGRLPAAPAQSPATAGIPGPTQQQMEAARSIPPSQQDAMVQGMVDRLASRLQQNPRDADGWIRLMRSRIVLNQPQEAAAALRSALAAFEDDATTQQRLRSAAGELGITTG
jgi:cytochrome c-type biogenesis protein CcmH